MAATKASASKQRPFKVPESRTRPIRSLKGVPPQCQAAAVMMSSDENREYAANILHEVSDFVKMPRVQSNAELQERINDYFDFCVEKRIPPTWEGMALYCGYTRSAFFDWATGRSKGFKDEKSDLTTNVIVQKAREVLAVFDATLVITGKIPVIPYIFRACNYYGMVNKQTVDIGSNTAESAQPLSRDQIIQQLGITNEEENDCGKR